MGRCSLLPCLVLVAVAASAPAATMTFDDPLAEQQWYHEPMQFGEAWADIAAMPRRGQTKVAVLDSGFQTNHLDLSQNLTTGINIVDGSANVQPVHPHGTAISGIPGARSGNGSGISQSAWTAKVLPVRISNRSDGVAYVSDIARAIRFAADSGARVINISYGGVASRTLAKAAAYATRKGALTFMAAGNSGHRTRWPNHRHLIAVG